MDGVARNLQRNVAVVVLWAMVSTSQAFSQTAASPSDAISRTIESDLESGAGVSPLDLEMLKTFYAARENRPAWYDDHGLNADGRLAIATIAAAAEHGLSADQYGLLNISKPLSGHNPALVADRDILLSAQFMHFATDLRAGRNFLKYLDADVDVPPSNFNVSVELSRALRDQKLTEFVQALPPQSLAYSALKSALARYRAISAKGGWRDLSFDRSFNIWTADDASLLSLRDRLSIEDPVLSAIVRPSSSDIEAALQRFQARNGQPSDGVMTPTTIASLNISASARALQIAANMERLRWLPRVEAKSYVTVNVPDATLQVVNLGVPILTSRVIVGRPKDPTPIFQAQITDVVANPPWIVPEKIARQEILPKAGRNPSYLARHHMIIVNGQVRQLPGQSNSLGLLKLEVTDRFSVYLHDTPSRALFAHNERFLSHGCVRVQQVIPLASYALTGDITGGVRRILSAIATGRTVHLPIKTPIPLYVNYFTAFVSTDGILQFRPDVYGRDNRMIAAFSGSRFSQNTGTISACRHAT